MLKVAVLVISLLISNLAVAHGEDVYGPHKGFVRMPGAFHTELVPNGENILKVYLLDIQWKNPSVSNSKLQIKYNGKINAECQIQDDFYNCVFPKSVNLTKKGELKVTAERENQKGMEVSYKLPLKLEVVNMGHGAKH
jgi:hypothetical protein